MVVEFNEEVHFKQRKINCLRRDSFAQELSCVLGIMGSYGECTPSSEQEG